MKKIFFLLLIFVFLFQFASFAVENEDFRFIVFGDSRVALPSSSTPLIFKRIIEESSLINPDFVMHTGDVVWGYGDSDEELKVEYNNVKEDLKNLIPKLYCVPGNHDLQGVLGSKLFSDTFNQKDPYFSFGYKRATFIVLNTELPSYEGQIGPDQLKWLEAQLEQAKGGRSVFVFMHRPLFSNVPVNTFEAISIVEQNFSSETNRKEVIDMLARYKVNAVFAGHEHLYYKEDESFQLGTEEAFNVPFYTLGGAGVPLQTTPDKGGFYHYLLVNVKGDKIDYELIQPGGLFVEQSSYKEAGKTVAEAIINNNITADYINRPVIVLEGLKFTLPGGDYKVESSPLISKERLIPLLQKIGVIDEGVSLEVVTAQFDLLFESIAKAEITKVFPHPTDPTRVDVYVKASAPALIPVKVVVKQI
ncbi:MAG: metallophosphoesterase [Candidatus Saganbacteria bacterium]|nr:metallophosphoesterase [Candidatus Saganbacteria bacterium]